jgi:hypothetical protein
MSHRRLLLLIAVAVGGCTTRTQRGAARDTSATVSSPDSRVSDSATVLRPTRPSTVPGDSARASDPVTAPRRTTPEPSPTIAEIVSSSAFVGKRVQVRGRCLGYSKPMAAGGPPRTRSDWQLEAGGVAIYVSGALPSGCSITEGSVQPIMISALVAEDTLSARGGRPARPRRFLVRTLE